MKKTEGTLGLLARDACCKLQRAARVAQSASRNVAKSSARGSWRMPQVAKLQSCKT